MTNYNNIDVHMDLTDDDTTQLNFNNKCHNTFQVNDIYNDNQFDAIKLNEYIDKKMLALNKLKYKNHAKKIKNKFKKYKIKKKIYIKKLKNKLKNIKIDHKTLFNNCVTRKNIKVDDVCLTKDNLDKDMDNYNLEKYNLDKDMDDYNLEKYNYYNGLSISKNN